MFKKVLSFLTIFLLVSAVFAGTTGKIAGVITDKQTGEPLPGVNVIIQDTYLGATTDVNGYYSVINVPVGVYSIRITYVGYKEVNIQNINVHVDHTTGLSYAMVFSGYLLLSETDRPPEPHVG